MRLAASVIEQAPVPGISFWAGIPASISRSSRAIRSAPDIEFASLVVPNTERPPAPWSSSHRQNATKRPESGSPLGVKGVKTGTSTPLNGCDVISWLLWLLSDRDGSKRPCRGRRQLSFALRSWGSQHRQHVGDERVADDIPVTEPHHGDVRYRVEPPGDFGKTGKAVKQIALVWVARYHHRRVPAQPRQQHLDLAISTVLRLVDDDEGVVQRPPTHISDRRDLDRSFDHQLFDASTAQPFVQRIVERAQVGRELVVDVAGEIAEALSCLDRWTRQHDAADLPSFESGHRGTDGEIGLAGSGRAHCDRQVVVLDRRHQSLLTIALRADLAPIALLALRIR